MNKPCECCERVFPETLLYSVSKKLYCRSCWRKKMRSLDLKWAFGVAFFFMFIGFLLGWTAKPASADEIDDGMRAQYRLGYAMEKGLFGYSCRQDKYYKCWEEAYNKASKWDRFWGTIKDSCPGVHSTELYEACKEEVNTRFPELPEDNGGVL